MRKLGCWPSTQSRLLFCPKLISWLHTVNLVEWIDENSASVYQLPTRQINDGACPDLLTNSPGVELEKIKRANTFLFSYRMRWCCRVCTVRTVLWAMVLRVALVANWKSNWRRKRTRAPRCRLVRQSTAVPAHLMPVPFLFLLLLTDVTHHLHFFFSFLLLSLLISGFRLFRPTSCK